MLSYFVKYYFNKAQPLKAVSFTETFWPYSAFLRLVQLINASLPIDSNEFGNWISSRLMQFSNALLPIAFTPSGNTTLTISLLPEKSSSLIVE